MKQGVQLPEDITSVAKKGTGKESYESMTSNGIDIETKTKRSFDTWFFSISKRNEPARSENFTIDEERRKDSQFYTGSNEKRKELF